MVILSDTDSTFLDLSSIINKNLEKDELVKAILDIAKHIQTDLNTHIKLISKNLFNIEEKNNILSLKQELICDKMYISGKRRYAQHIINKEGIDVDYLSIMGLDIMKSNFPPYFKEFNEGLIEGIMYGDNKEKTTQKIKIFKKSLKEIDVDKILKPTGLNKINEYIESPPIGNIFSTLKLRCPINTKAAIYSNDLIRYFNYDNNYPLFNIGDKILIGYLKKNPYNIEIIAVNGYNDAPIILDILNKYIDREKIFDSILLNKLQNLYNDLGWGELILNNNIFDLF